MESGLGNTRGQDYKLKEKHKTRLKTNVKRTVLNNTKLRHFWAQIVSWAPIHARKTSIILAPGKFIVLGLSMIATNLQIKLHNELIHPNLKHANNFTRVSNYLNATW